MDHCLNWFCQHHSPTPTHPPSPSFPLLLSLLSRYGAAILVRVSSQFPVTFSSHLQYLPANLQVPVPVSFLTQLQYPLSPNSQSSPRLIVPLCSLCPPTNRVWLLPLSAFQSGSFPLLFLLAAWVPARGALRAQERQSSYSLFLYPIPPQLTAAIAGRVMLSADGIFREFSCQRLKSLC